MSCTLFATFTDHRVTQSAILQNAEHVRCLYIACGHVYCPSFRQYLEVAVSRPLIGLRWCPRVAHRASLKMVTKVKRVNCCAPNVGFRWHNCSDCFECLGISYVYDNDNMVSLTLIIRSLYSWCLYEANHSDSQNEAMQQKYFAKLLGYIPLRQSTRRKASTQISLIWQLVYNRFDFVWVVVRQVVLANPASVRLVQLSLSSWSLTSLGNLQSKHFSDAILSSVPPRISIFVRQFPSLRILRLLWLETWSTESRLPRIRIFQPSL